MQRRGRSALLTAISLLSHLVLVPLVFRLTPWQWWTSYTTATPMTFLAIVHGWSLYRALSSPSGPFRTISGIFAVVSWGVILSLLVPALWVIHIAFQIVPFMGVNLLAPLLLFAYIAVLCVERLGLFARSKGCPTCGYSLRGLPTNQCPECGQIHRAGSDRDDA